MSPARVNGVEAPFTRSSLAVVENLRKPKTCAPEFVMGPATDDRSPPQQSNSRNRRREARRMCTLYRKFSRARSSLRSRRRDPPTSRQLRCACAARRSWRRTTRRRSRRRLGGLAESTQVARDALGVGDHREQTHAALASRACEHDEARGSLQELGPRAIRTSSRHVRDVLHARRACRLRRPRPPGWTRPHPAHIASISTSRSFAPFDGPTSPRFSIVSTIRAARL
jgi:hypothetical protein